MCQRNSNYIFEFKVFNFKLYKLSLMVSNCNRVFIIIYGCVF